MLPTKDQPSSIISQAYIKSLLIYLRLHFIMSSILNTSRSINFHKNILSSSSSHPALCYLNISSLEQSILQSRVGFKFGSKWRSSYLNLDYQHLKPLCNHDRFYYTVYMLILIIWMEGLACIYFLWKAPLHIKITQKTAKNLKHSLAEILKWLILDIRILGNLVKLCGVNCIIQGTNGLDQSTVYISCFESEALV